MWNRLGMYLHVDIDSLGQIDRCTERPAEIKLHLSLFHDRLPGAVILCLRLAPIVRRNALQRAYQGEPHSHSRY